MRPEELNFSDLKQILGAAMSRPLPGVNAHAIMAPVGRAIQLPSEQQLLDAKKAAVLALLFPENKIPKLLLTQRVEYKGVHSGQISFPGGKAEDFDEDFAATALRETHEEVGIHPDEVEVAGKFSQLYIPPSNFLVHPYLGFLNDHPETKKQESEVHRILKLDFRSFLSEANLKETTVNARYQKLKVPAFVIEDHIIWGATAMMLAELRTIVLQS